MLLRHGSRRVTSFHSVKRPWSTSGSIRMFWNPPELIENKGSIARDILATERTFLAWSRTGLGFVGAGSALFAAYHRYHTDDEEEEDDDVNNINEEPGRVQHHHHQQQQQRQQHHLTTMKNKIVPACALLIANGGFLLIFATRRYLTLVSALRRDQYIVDTRGTLMAILITSISTVTSLGLAFKAQIQDNDFVRRRVHQQRNNETKERT